MAPQGQVVLRAAATGGSTKIPMFLQKLNRMLDDSETNDLISWSEAGDSFFILDHERFAREILPSYFKHCNFHSFVRQLNMYGFHKIPHLQQGVLRSDSTPELWEFARENFHRGGNELLGSIERKKQMQQTKDQPAMDFNVASSSAPPIPALAGANTVDIQHIVSGIAAIRHHQTAISAELDELKRSNQTLWQESMEARARHQKQQDTINRIVKFLAGVFGNSTPATKDNERHPSPTVKPMQPTRLMIEGRRRDSGGGKVEITEVMDEDDIRDPSPLPTNRFMTVDTPAASSAAVSPAMTDASAFPATPLSEFPPSPAETPTQTQTHEPVPSQMAPNSIVSTQPQYPSNTQEGIITPSRSPTIDPKIQAVLNQLTASDLAQFLNSLEQFPSPPSPSEHQQQNDEQSQSQPQASTSQLAPYQQPYDFFGSSFPLLTSPRPLAQAPPLPNPGGTEGLISFDAPSPKMSKMWKATEDIDKDVNSINGGLNSLIQTLGLDPSYLDSSILPDSAPPLTNHNNANIPTSTPTNPTQPFDPSANSIPPVTPSSSVDHSHPSNAQPQPNSGGTESQFPTQDFFDSFLNTFSAPDPNQDNLFYEDPTATAFLDEVPSPASPAGSHSANSRHSASPTVNTSALPAEQKLAQAVAAAAAALPSQKGVGTRGRKRKSGVALSEDVAPTPVAIKTPLGGGRAKRRRGG